MKEVYETAESLNLNVFYLSFFFFVSQFCLETEGGRRVLSQ